MDVNKRIKKLTEEAEGNWDMKGLLQDLGRAKEEFNPKRPNLTPKEYHCLCGLLCNYQPYEIADILIVSRRGIRVDLARYIYRYVEKLIQLKAKKDDFKIKAWFQVSRELEKLNYKTTLYNPTEIKELKQTQATLVVDAEEISSQQLEAIVAMMRQIPGNLSLEIKGIHRGSIEIVFETTEEGTEWLEQLHAIGELEELLGVPVLGVRREEAIADLGEWLQEARDTFAAGWQTVKFFLNNLGGDGAAYRFSSAVRAGEIKINDFEVIASGIKLLDLGEPLAGRPIPLVVNLGRESGGERDILLQVYPCKGERYLPRGLQMLVLVGGDIFLEATAAEADDYIQLRCSGQPGEKFSVKLVLGDASVSENFLF